LLHEMCHAAAWVVDAVAKPPHGPCFKKWANTAMENVPDVVVTTMHDYEIEFSYAWACTTPKCGAVIKRHSRSIDVYKQVCGKCRGKLMEIELPSAGGNGPAEHTPRKAAPLSVYNLFVKEHSASVRKQLEEAVNDKVSQAEVMRECARRWRETNKSE
jgi:SprT-like family